MNRLNVSDTTGAHTAKTAEACGDYNLIRDIVCVVNTAEVCTACAEYGLIGSLPPCASPAKPWETCPLPCMDQTCTRYSDFSLKRLLWFPSSWSLHRIVLTKTCHCSQNLVIGHQSPCPYIENVLTSTVFTERSYCVVIALAISRKPSCCG